MLALRLAVFDHLIDIGRIGELQGIERRNGSLWIGAGTTEAAVGASAEVAAAVPLLSKATPFIGHFQIRNRGTLGRIDRACRSGRRVPGCRAGPGRDLGGAVAPGDTVASRPLTSSMASGARAFRRTSSWSGVSFPVWSGRSGFAVEEFARRHGDFAIAGAALGVEVDDDDRIRRCAIGLIGLGSTPERAGSAEAAACRRVGHRRRSRRGRSPARVANSTSVPYRPSRVRRLPQTGGGGHGGPGVGHSQEEARRG